MKLFLDFECLLSSILDLDTVFWRRHSVAIEPHPVVQCEVVRELITVQVSRILDIAIGLLKSYIIYLL